MDNDDLEKTRALNDLTELVKQSNDNEFIDLPDDINEKNESKEELFNDLTNNDSNKDEDNKENNNDEGKDNKKESLIDKFKKLPKKNKRLLPRRRHNKGDYRSKKMW